MDKNQKNYTYLAICISLWNLFIYSSDDEDNLYLRHAFLTDNSFHSIMESTKRIIENNTIEIFFSNENPEEATCEEKQPSNNTPKTTTSINNYPSPELNLNDFGLDNVLLNTQSSIIATNNVMQRKRKSKENLAKNSCVKKQKTTEKKFKYDHPGCTKSYASQYSLKTHEHIHNPDQWVKCDQPGCTYKSTNKYYLKTHKLIHNTDQWIKCDHPGCTKSYPTQNSLDKHERSHNPGQWIKCDHPECTYKSTEKYRIKRHQESMNCPSRPNFNDDKAPDNFLSLFIDPSAADPHLTFEGENTKEASCEEKQNVASLDLLSNAIATNNVMQQRKRKNKENLAKNSYAKKQKTTKKKFKCDHPGCTKSYASQKSLNKHKRSHFPDQWFKCDQPGCTYKSIEKCKIKPHQESRNCPSRPNFNVDKTLDNILSLCVSPSAATINGPYLTFEGEYTEEATCEEKQSVASLDLLSNAIATNHVMQQRKQKSKENLAKNSCAKKQKTTEKKFKCNQPACTYKSTVKCRIELHQKSRNCHFRPKSNDEKALENTLSLSRDPSAADPYLTFEGIDTEKAACEEKQPSNNTPKATTSTNNYPPLELDLNDFGLDNVLLNTPSDIITTSNVIQQRKRKSKENLAKNSCAKKQKTTKKKFKCDHPGCNFSSANKYYLKTHELIHNPNQWVKCDHSGCTKSYPTQKSLDKHKRSHSPDQWFKCDQPECTYKSTVKWRIKQHQKSMNCPFRPDFNDDKARENILSLSRDPSAADPHLTFEGENTEEATCEKKQNVASLNLLTNAIATSNGMQQRKRKSKENLAKNSCAKKQKTTEKKFKCDYPGCNFSSAYSSNLRHHKRIHNPDQWFKCDHDGCNFSSAHSSNFRDHIRSHNPDQWFKCDHDGCNFSSANKYYLKKHKLIHNPDQWVKCDRDGYSYKSARKNSLKKHQKRKKMSSPNDSRR